MGSTLKVDNIVGTSGTSAPITLSGDTATLGSGVAMAANHSGVKTALNASGTAPIYACRAWVNFNGTGTVAIRGSGNVSSVTDNGTGDYTINFTTDMSDVNYCIAGSSGGQGGTSNGAVYQYDQATAKSQSLFRILIVNSSGNVTDTPQIAIAVFR